MQGRGTDEEGEGSIAAEATLESGSLTTCQLTSSACPPEGESLCGKERLLQFVDLPSLSTMVSGGEGAGEGEVLRGHGGTVCDEPASMRDGAHGAGDQSTGQSSGGSHDGHRAHGDEDGPPVGAGDESGGLGAAPACATMWEACADCRAGRECTGGSDGEEAEEREELCSAKSCPAWRSIARRMLWIAGEERIITPKQVLRNRDMDRRVPPRCAQQEACLARVMSYPLRPNTVAT